MTLKVTTAPRDGRQLEMQIEVPKERVDQELRKAAAYVASQYRLPGFRKGKAPYHIVVQQFGLANLYGEFVDKLGEEVYKAALEQESIEPYAMASLENVTFDPLTYTLVLPLEPLVDLGDYRSVRVDVPETSVDSDAVDELLDELLAEHASWQEVEGPSAFGDMLTTDVKSVIAPAAEGDAPVVVLDETDWDVTPDAENPMDPPGFDDALIGMQKGETKEFVLAWPADSKSVHAGKEATFTVTVKQIERYQKPELNDDFAALVDEEVPTLEALRAKLSEDVQASQANEAANAYTTEAIGALLKVAKLEYPPAVVEDQIDSMLRDYEMQLRQMGIENLAGFFEQTGQSMDNFRASLREQAVITAERNLILSEIIRAEQLKVSDEEIEARIAEMVQLPDDADEDAHAQFASMQGLFKSEYGRALISNDLLREKAVARVQAIARGEELPELDAEVESTSESTTESTTESASESTNAVMIEGDAEAAPNEAADEPAAPESAA